MSGHFSTADIGGRCEAHPPVSGQTEARGDNIPHFGGKGVNAKHNASFEMVWG